MPGAPVSEDDPAAARGEIADHAAQRVELSLAPDDRRRRRSRLALLRAEAVALRDGLLPPLHRDLVGGPRAKRCSSRRAVT